VSDILTDFAPSSLIRAIETNTIGTFLTWAKWAELDLHQDTHEIWITSEIPFFIFNVVLKAEDPSAEPGLVINAAMSLARARQVPMGWWVGPFEPFAGMGELLEAKGFFHAATLTGMAVDLLTLPEPASMHSGFTISEVKNADDLETWCRVMTQVSEFPDFAQAAWLEMFSDIGIIDDPQWRLYLGRDNGTAVSTSSLYLGAGVAGIHSVTTVPEFRGRGIGREMTHRPLLDARGQGRRVGVLYSSEMAVNLYRGLGFQEYGRGEIYAWQAPDEESEQPS